MNKFAHLYPELALQLYMKSISIQELSELSGIPYGTLRRKLMGETDFLLSEAVKIREVIVCQKPLEELFRTQERPA